MTERAKTVKFYDLGDEVWVQKTGNYGEENSLSHQKFSPSAKARLASAMAERWGMVAAVSDGYDGQGRAKVRTLTPEEIVVKACSTADLLVDKMAALGWMRPTPTAQELFGLPGDEED